jgi:hypothetical protein
VYTGRQTGRARPNSAGMRVLDDPLRGQARRSRLLPGVSGKSPVGQATLKPKFQACRLPKRGTPIGCPNLDSTRWGTGLFPTSQWRGLKVAVACFGIRAHKAACQNLIIDPVSAVPSTAAPRPWHLAARSPASNVRCAVQPSKPGTRRGCQPIG